MIPLLILLLAAGQVAPPDTGAAVPIPPARPGAVRAFDTPNDAGKSITLRWSAADTLAQTWLIVTARYGTIFCVSGRIWGPAHVRSTVVRDRHSG